MSKDKITMAEAFEIMEITRQTYGRWKKMNVKGLPVAEYQGRPRKGPYKMFDRKEVEAFRKSDWYSNE